MKVLAFAASSSSKSINKQLVGYAGQLLNEQGIEVEYLDMNDYEMPLYSSDRQEANGIPQLAIDFYQKIGEADALMISYAEHNGSYAAVYKNLYDWTSRYDMRVFQDKPMLIMAASPGPGGAKNVLSVAKTSAPFFGGNVKADLSLPSFFDNFDMEKGILSNQELDTELKSALAALVK